jgi:hypothetical protein
MAGSQGRQTTHVIEVQVRDGQRTYLGQGDAELFCVVGQSWPLGPKSDVEEQGTAIGAKQPGDSGILQKPILSLPVNEHR